MSYQSTLHPIVAYHLTSRYIIQHMASFNVVMHCIMPCACPVVSDSATPWTAARQISLSFTISQGLLKLIFIESVMPYSHLILCRPLLLLPSIFLSIRVFSNELSLRIRWPKYWSFGIHVIYKLSVGAQRLEVAPATLESFCLLLLIEDLVYYSGHSWPGCMVLCPGPWVQEWLGALPSWAPWSVGTFGFPGPSLSCESALQPSVGDYNEVGSFS